jgi:predicted ATP-dependent serine protease
VGRLASRLREASRLGFERALVPRSTEAPLESGLELHPVADVAGAAAILFRGAETSQIG